MFGHRGASGECPENTLPAFERALSQGADALETDVHRSADGEVVVCHDADLARMTDASGPVAARTWSELAALDAGYGFSPDEGQSHPYRGRGVRMPRLRELFEAFPETRINIEFKANDPELVASGLAEIRAFDRAERTLVAAERDETMATVRAAVADSGLPVAMGAAIGDVVEVVKAATAGGAPPSAPMALQIPPAFAGQPLVTPQLVAFAREHQIAIHVWTINDPAEMARLLDLGVDGLMSDFPGRLRRVVDERASREPG